jgi:tRNA threonylcarbamoyladenosine biosynthesis protein TsaB
MRILALETSGMSGSIALWDANSDKEAQQWRLPVGTRSARSLVPTVKQALAELGWQTADINLIGVTAGPGSFTGLRVGVVFAKGMGFAIKCPVVGVNTLEAIAAQALQSIDGTVSAVLDAQRGELFSARYCRNATSTLHLEEVQATAIVTVGAWISALKPGDGVTGPGLQICLGILPDHVHIADETLWQPEATSVAACAWQKYQRQQCGAEAQFDALALLPEYFRRTAAEEQWTKRNSTSQV